MGILAVFAADYARVCVKGVQAARRLAQREYSAEERSELVKDLLILAPVHIILKVFVAGYVEGIRTHVERLRRPVLRLVTSQVPCRTRGQW
eukprot:NODE_8553_length_377_cov_312.285714.p1 GENE.NODE_8553_length_377_cov_312.285714~~NODE_8553_length_377_cov_312.285714.p1  ORF type:complete len:91 (+),score=16.54 NODE_8553_length_377_cov_312.285714:3-275(+)